MYNRFHELKDFVSHFLRYALFVREVLVGLLILLLLGGVAIAYLEDLPLGEAIYFTFVTGLSVGYGDISPKTAPGRMLSVMIGMVGMILTGMTVAVATRALADATRERVKHEHPS